MQPLPGFRDFLPHECAERNYIFGKWRQVARRYGFVEWDGPVLEATALYTRKSGSEIVGQLFNFTDKGEREVAMRPELTPTLARVIAAHNREFKKPLKWFSIPQCFRYEKQQRGRLREHFQLNCDIIGDASAEADSELIALAIDLLRGFGFTSNDVVVRISDRQFWAEFLRNHRVPEPEWQQVLQIIDKSEREDRRRTADQLGKLAQPVFEIVDKGGESSKLNGIVANLALRGLSDFAEVDVRIVRGLAYYTGVVFEVFDRSGKFRAIAGGGRYDTLVEQLSDGAASLPALGFAMGDVVLGELVRSTAAARERMGQAIALERPLDVFAIIAKEDRRPDAIATVQKLRDRGLRVDYSLSAISIPRQFQLAEASRARFAVVFGDEWPAVGVKNLEIGVQQPVAHADLVAHLTAQSSRSSGELPTCRADSVPRA